jgi:hypothetical protein
MPRFLPGTADIAFISAMFCAMAARLTDRCSDHATRPRHSNTQAPRKPNIAPTQMNTVPSGRSDFCIKKAPDVSGTCWLGTPTPASVGRPESWTMPCVTVGKEPSLSAVAAVVPEGDALDCTDDVACADDAAADEDGAADDAAEVALVPLPSGCWIVDNCGRLVLSCASTTGAAASSRPNRPTEGRIVNVCMTLSECCGVVWGIEGPA